MRSGVAQVEYLYLDGVPVGVNTGGVRYYVETDHLGTPRQVIDPARNVAVWTWDALASTFRANSPDPNPDGDGSKFAFNLRFPGQYYDAETGLNYNLARDYEAGTGRYVESDPIGLSSGINTYNYVGQNPLQRSDPTGRFWGELIVGGGIVGGTCAVIWCFKHTFEECARQYPDRRENRVSQSGFSICIKNPASICKLLMWLVEPAGEAAKLPAETANDHPEPTSCSECGGK